MTDAAAYKGHMLRHGLLDKSISVQPWADTAYRSRKNEAFLVPERLYQPGPSQEARRSPDADADPSRQWSQVLRARIEHVFAEQKDRMVLFSQTVGFARARL